MRCCSKAAEAGCQIVDLEVESAEEAKPAQLAKFRAGLRAAGAALLVSFHDFTRTKGLEQAAERIEAFQPDFVKVVSTARSLADNLAVLQADRGPVALGACGGHRHGRRGAGEPRARAAGRRGLHLCLVCRRRGDRSRPGDRAHPARPLPRRAARPGDAHLRRGRQPHRPLAFAADAQHRLPPRERERRAAAAEGAARWTTC